MSTNIVAARNGRITLASGQEAAPKAQGRPESNSEEIKAIIEAVQSTKFGEVTVIVQDGYVVQVNRLEKRRLR